MNIWIRNQFNTQALDQELQQLCVKCVEAFLNHEFGLHYILQDRSGIEILTDSICTETPLLMQNVVKILAAICLKDHQKVLKAISFKFSADRNQLHRFTAIVSIATQREQILCVTESCLFSNHQCVGNNSRRSD